MTASTVLIAGLSGRALSQAARRADLAPLVVDAFGDEDTRDCALALKTLPDALARGFRTKSLIAALDDLMANAPAPPIGLILGTGFEDRPGVIAQLARTYPILGCGASVVRASKDPFRLAELLAQKGIATPTVARSLPVDADQDVWLRKRVGGSGGGDITRASRDDRASTRFYVQRQINGQALSLLVVADSSDRSCQPIGFTEQWTHPTKTKPFRYGGAAGPLNVAKEFAHAMISTANELVLALGLVGLVSIDFVASGTTPYVIEINPRPGATLDIFDTADGQLLRAHIAAACRQPLPATTIPENPTARATAYLYADQGAVSIGELCWPSWVADRPMPGTQISANSPIATVFAQAASPQNAKTVCQTHLGQLRDMVYTDKKMEAQPK